MSVGDDSPMVERPEYEVGIDHATLYLPSGSYLTPDEARFELGLSVKGYCLKCGNKIMIQIFKDEDFCSDNCRKAIGKDIV